MKSFTSIGSGFYVSVTFSHLFFLIANSHPQKSRRHIKRGEITQCKQIQAISHRP